jgi:speckle-type POZ protein
MRPATRTKSRCAPQTACGTHALEIVRYSLHKGLGKGKFIQSAAFVVGGYKWCVIFFPDGDEREKSIGYVSVFLKLLSQKAKVRASYDFRLVDQTTGSSMVTCSKGRGKSCSTQ